MVAPAALSFGSCAALTLSQSEKAFLSNTSHRKLAYKSNNALQQRPRPLNLSQKTPLIRPVPAATAVAVDSNQLGSSEQSEKEESTKYYFVVANAKFMLDEEEHFQELLCERLRNYQERKKERDFWLVIEPKILEKFPNIAKRLKRPAVALVSTNGTWITYMKLRLDRVLAESYEAKSVEEALASNPTDLKFEKPENWVAPYTKYETRWWEPFLPPVSSTYKA